VTSIVTKEKAPLGRQSHYSHTIVQRPAQDQNSLIAII
jgi:hypothetical protein